VRLSVANAATLFALVKKEGMKNTHVALVGEIPDAGAGAIARRQPAQPRYQAQVRDQQDYDDDDTGTLPPGTRAAPVYRETPRYYDYSDRNYYGAPRRSYGSFPFGW
jgi:hypothetical protein